MKVVLTHLWPESNAGDYAIVRGTIDAIEDSSLEPVRFIGITTFAKHGRSVNDHFSETIAKGVELRPAIIPGYKNDDCLQFSKIEKAILSLKYIAIFICLILGLRRLASVFVSKRCKETLKDISEADLVVVKGGAFLMGFPGVAGTLYLLRNALTVMWCAKLNKKCIIAPHSFGPIANKFQYWLLGVMLKGITIYAREKISIRLLKEAGLNSSYLPDMAFYFGCQLPEKKNSKQIAVTVRPCPTFLSADRQRSYYSELTNGLVRLVKSGYQILFVPQVSGPDSREDDREAIKEISRSVISELGSSDHVRFCDPKTLKEKFEAYGQSICCLGTRMHSVIFSTLAASNVVALAYLGPKHKGIMDELKLGDFVLDITNVKADEVVEKVHASIAMQDVNATSRQVELMKEEIGREFKRLLKIK